MFHQHSFHTLYFHLVFTTKNRQPLIGSVRDGETILELFTIKAKALEAYIEEFGCWREHVHLLVRSPPKLALSVLYGQMKGFCSRAWNKRRPGAPIGWQDGVYSITVDPDNCTPLREYIRSQWQRHEQGDLITRWEPPEITR